MLAAASALIGGWFFCEFVGYFLHILLHSERIPYLSRSHMIHHLKVYNPKQGLRQGGSYKGSAQDRTSVLGFGLEWVAPIAFIMIVTALGFWLLQIAIVYYFIFTLSAILWGYFLFGYMHDAMHLKEFWMERVPFLRDWFYSIRKLHDIHHLEFSNDGRMLKNYGICFFFFDRLFVSLSPKHKLFNQDGFTASMKRYDKIINY